MQPYNFSNPSVGCSLKDAFRDAKPWQDPILMGNEPVKRALKMLDTSGYEDLYDIVSQYASSIASVSINIGTHQRPALFPRGTGIFLSSNLFVTSAHLLAGADLKQQECVAEVGGTQFHLKCLMVDPNLDYAAFYLDDKKEIAKLKSLDLQYPALPSRNYKDDLAAMDGYHVMLFSDESGEKKVSIAEPEYSDHFDYNFSCAFPGGPGASGSPIFDSNGVLVAIHSTRHEEFENVRSSCFLREVVHQLKDMTSLDKEGHLCLKELDSGTLKKCHRVALENIASIDLNSLDGIPERIDGTFKRNGKTYHYDELRENDGPSNRGLKCFIKGQANSVTDYMFSPNPHHIKAYADKKEKKPKLYETAAQALAKVPGNEDWPKKFAFKEYKTRFVANRLD